MDLSLCLAAKSFKIELFEQVGGNKDKRRPGLDFRPINVRSIDRAKNDFTESWNFR